MFDPINPGQQMADAKVMVQIEAEQAFRRELEEDAAHKSEWDEAHLAATRNLPAIELQRLEDALASNYREASSIGTFMQVGVTEGLHSALIKLDGPHTDAESVGDRIELFERQGITLDAGIIVVHKELEKGRWEVAALIETSSLKEDLQELATGVEKQNTSLKDPDGFLKRVTNTFEGRTNSFYEPKSLLDKGLDFLFTAYGRPPHVAISFHPADSAINELRGSSHASFESLSRALKTKVLEPRTADVVRNVDGTSEVKTFSHSSRKGAKQIFKI